MNFIISFIPSLLSSCVVFQMDRSRLALHKDKINALVAKSSAGHKAICARCILRYSNCKQVFVANQYEQIVADLISLLEHEEITPISIEKLNVFCNSCFNVLSDSFVEQKSKQIEASVIENGFRSVDNFQLQIHLPVVLTLRNNYFQKLFGLENEEIISVKELFKVQLAAKLSNLLEVKLNSDSNFVIEITVDHENGNKECDQLVDIAPNTFYQRQCLKSSAQSYVNHSSVARVISQLSVDSLSSTLKLSDQREECVLSRIELKHEPIYIAGRYMKFSRNLSQTPWIVDGGNLFMASVQERITSGVEQYIKFKDIKFSSSGREDVDVRMLGAGRPFLLEILNPRILTKDSLMKKIKSFINDSYSDVKVRDLQLVDKVQSQKFLKEGEQSKTKTYQALCCLTRPYTEQDFELIKQIKNLRLTQKTPIRVLHRRTLSDRTRTVFDMWAEPVTENEVDQQYRPFVDRIFKLNLTTEAGTYIKEFVHSDFGRTTPNLCTLLGNCAADIITLDVMEVNVDWPPKIDDGDNELPIINSTASVPVAKKIKLQNDEILKIDDTCIY